MDQAEPHPAAHNYMVEVPCTKCGGAIAVGLPDGKIVLPVVCIACGTAVDDVIVALANVRLAREETKAVALAFVNFAAAVFEAMRLTPRGADHLPLIVREVSTMMEAEADMPATIAIFSTLSKLADRKVRK